MYGSGLILLVASLIRDISNLDLFLLFSIIEGDNGMLRQRHLMIIKERLILVVARVFMSNIALKIRCDLLVFMGTRVS